MSIPQPLCPCSTIFGIPGPMSIPYVQTFSGYPCPCSTSFWDIDACIVLCTKPDFLLEPSYQLAYIYSVLKTLYRVMLGTCQSNLGGQWKALGQNCGFGVSHYSEVCSTYHVLFPYYLTCTADAYQQAVTVHQTFPTLWALFPFATPLSHRSHNRFVLLDVHLT